MTGRAGCECGALVLTDSVRVAHGGQRSAQRGQRSPGCLAGGYCPPRTPGCGEGVENTAHLLSCADGAAAQGVVGG